MTKKSGQLASKGILTGLMDIYSLRVLGLSTFQNFSSKTNGGVLYWQRDTVSYIFSLWGKCFGKRCFLSYSLCP
nr:MAG TPA: hypothetical protein [Caudoviricetes sp.]